MIKMRGNIKNNALNIRIRIGKMYLYRTPLTHQPFTPYPSFVQMEPFSTNSSLTVIGGKSACMSTIICNWCRNFIMTQNLSSGSMLTVRLPLVFMDWLKVLLVPPEVMMEMSVPVQLQSPFLLLIVRDLSRPVGLPDKEIQIVPITGCAV